MVLKFKPLKLDNLFQYDNMDGYSYRDDLVGPLRKQGKVYYYDPMNGKLFNPKTKNYEQFNKIYL